MSKIKSNHDIMIDVADDIDEFLQDEGIDLEDEVALDLPYVLEKAFKDYDIIDKDIFGDCDDYDDSWLYELDDDIDGYISERKKKKKKSDNKINKKSKLFEHILGSLSGVIIGNLIWNHWLKDKL